MTRRHAWLLVLLIAIAVRVASLGTYPLHDTTEARYADIARIMVTTNEWVVPQIQPGVPFWAKPPLSIWATAASFKQFGYTELAARLPALLFILAAMAAVFTFGVRRSSITAALAACAVFMSTGLGFIGAGAVMTDAALTLAVTLSVVSFAARIEGHLQWTATVFYLGLGLGLLAKGPIALVLVAIPVFLWAVTQRSLTWLWGFLPWFRGTLFVGLLALPWYVAAEIKSPGFINYFLVGEHFLRFIDSGWSGDLYGSAHDRPFGTIWVFGIAGLMPWSLIGLYAIYEARSASGRSENGADSSRFLWYATLSPLLFFTLAGNILPAYVMPSLAGFSILMGRWLEARHAAWCLPGLAAPLAVALLIYSGVLDTADAKSQKGNIHFLESQESKSPIYYYERMPHSASFYSDGGTKLIGGAAELSELLARAADGWLLVRTKHEHLLSAEARECLGKEGQSGDYTLFSFGRCVSVVDRQQTSSTKTTGV